MYAYMYVPAAWSMPQGCMHKISLNAAGLRHSLLAPTIDILQRYSNGDANTFTDTATASTRSFALSPQLYVRPPWPTIPQSPTQLRL